MLAISCVQDEEIRENIKHFLLQHLLAEIPRNAGNRDRIFDCITSFALGNSAFTREYLELEKGGDQVLVEKYIFRYGDEDLRRSVLTMVFRVRYSSIVILDIKNDDNVQRAIPLPQNRASNVNRVTCILDNQRELTVTLDQFDLPGQYAQRHRRNYFDGDLIEVPNAENVHNTLNQVMNDGWQDES